MTLPLFPICVQHLSDGLALRPVDADTVAILAARLAEMEPWRGLGFTASGLACYLARDDIALHRYGVLQQGVLSGVMAIRYPWLRGAYLELFGLFGEMQGQNVGRQLIAWLASRTATESSNLWATVSASNDRARRFYAHYGFVPIGDIPDLVRPGCTEILLRLPLRHS